MIQAIVVVGLTSFTITFFLKYMDGPGKIFEHIRRWVKVSIPMISASGQIVNWLEDDEPDTLLANIFACFWCLTTWVTLIVTAVYIIIGYSSWIGLPFIWLASAGLSGYIHARIIDG